MAITRVLLVEHSTPPQIIFKKRKFIFLCSDDYLRLSKDRIYPAWLQQGLRYGPIGLEPLASVKTRKNKHIS